jgi:hypothetical protein
VTTIVEDDGLEIELAVAGDNVRTLDMLKEPEIWVCDTGATHHSCRSKEGAINERPASSSTLGHAGNPVKEESIIDLKGQFMTDDGEMGIEATLTEVSVNQKYNFNLFSLTRLLIRGWHVARGDASSIVIEDKDGNRIVFDIVIRTVRGAIYATRFIRETSEVSAVGTEAGTVMNVYKAHALLGHSNEDSVRQTSKHLGWELTRGTMRQKPCEECARSKAKQKALGSGKKKTSDTPELKPGDIVHLDLSKVTAAKSDGSEVDIPRKHCEIIVDKATGKKWISFYRTKDEMVEPTCQWISKMKARGIPILAIRMDPGGENIKLEKRLESAEWQSLQPVDVQVTSRDTPQHNSKVEVSFPHIAGLARANLNAAGIPDVMRALLVSEAMRYSVQVDSLAMVNLNGKLLTREEHVFGNKPKWVNNMRIWGEAGVVKTGKDKKTGNRGATMMFVAYSNRESDSCRMFDPNTKRVVVTRDIIWLGRMYYAPKPVESDVTIELDLNEDLDAPPAEEEKESNEDDDSDDDESVPAHDSTGDEDENEDDESVAREDDTPVQAPVDATVTTSRSGRVSQAPSRLIETMSSMLDGSPGTLASIRYLQLMAEVDEQEIEGEFSMMSHERFELSLVGAGLVGGFNNVDELRVLNYQEAMSSDDAEEWKKEVVNEKIKFDKFNATTPVKRSELPPNAKVLQTTWAFKLKANGDRRARMNAKGFQQRDGIHYFSDSTYAPVTNPVAIRMLFTVLAMNPDYIASILDIVGAFLQGKFYDGEVLYIEVPDGFEPYYEDDEVLRLNVPIYGTKQASKCFYKTFVEGLVDSGMYDRSKAQPCMFYKWIDERLVLFVLWTDDVLTVGLPDHVKKVEDDIKSVFESKSEGEVTEYVGNKIDIQRSDDGRARVKFTQPVLIEKLKEANAEALSVGGAAPRTPAIEGQVLVRGDGSGELSRDDAKHYRSNVALMNYMSQWSRPEIQNPVRGMARHMQAPRLAHLNAMNTAVRYIVATELRGWELYPDTTWDGSREFMFRISGRADSNYAADTDNRRSVSGGRTFLNESPVIVRSNTQRTVSLSVTEAEQNAGVIVAQDMIYLMQTMNAVGLKVELPMVLEMDNIGAVHQANNMSVGGRTRHVDVKSHFLRELKEEGLLVIKHISGDDNDSDIFTKNTSVKVFERHIPKFVGTDEYMSSTSDNT